MEMVWQKRKRLSEERAKEVLQADQEAAKETAKEALQSAMDTRNPFFGRFKEEMSAINRFETPGELVETIYHYIHYYTGLTQK